MKKNIDKKSVLSRRGYTIKKEKYSPRIIQSIRKDLMVKPVTLRQFSQCVQSFQVYLESINKYLLVKNIYLKGLP